MRRFLEKYWPYLVIIGLWVVFSFPYLFKGLVPFPSKYLVTFFPPWNSEYGMPVKNNAMPDVISQIYPWKKLTIDTWKMGQIPLWNPYSFSGTPHAGNYQSAVFSPVNLLFFVLPFIDAWSIMVLLQPLLAGMFMYVFVKSLGRSQSASLLSAIAFMFCGFMVVWMAYGTLGYAALFLPLIFWGVHTKKGRAVSAGIALSLLSGHFQVSVYVLAAALLYIAWKKQWKTLWFVFFGLLIAAPQILLGIKSFIDSARGGAILKGEIIPWQYLMTFIAPDFYGNPVTRNDWFGHYAEWAGFIGVVPLMLALGAAFGKKSKEEWFFVVLAVTTLLFALPTPFNSLLYLLKIPVLSGSAASRVIILTSFSLAVLAAYGLDRVKEKKYTTVFSLASIVFVAAVWAVLLVGKPLPPDKLSIATHNFVLPSALVLVASIILLVKKNIFMYLLIVLAAFDVLRFAAKWMPFDPRPLVFPEIKSITKLQEVAGVNRVFGNIGPGEVGVSFHIPVVEGYDAVYQARYGEFINVVSKGYVYPAGRSVVLFDKAGVNKIEAFQLLGVKYIYHRLSDGRNVWAFPYWEYPSIRQIYIDEQYEIFEYPDVYPRAFLASSYVLGGIDKLFSQNLNRRETLVLEEKPLLEPERGTGSAAIRSYTPNNVTIETESESPKLLFLSDVFDKGWRATVDGKISPVYRADYDFRAVAVPAGKHIVELRYHPDEFRWGIILTVIGALLMLVVKI